MRLRFPVFLALAVLLLASAPAVAASLNVVALGASNTYGKGRGSTAGGVPSSQAFPAQLQALLRARGIDARVTNAGVPGDTTAGMLARLDRAVPKGTHVVILQPGGNDARRGQGGDTAATVSAITGKLQARGIKVIVLDRVLSLVPKESRDPDGQHFDARGHAAVAAHLLPQVMAARGQWAAARPYGRLQARRADSR
jgi:acyl-CoA thioesterase-1